MTWNLVTPLQTNYGMSIVSILPELSSLKLDYIVSWHLSFRISAPKRDPDSAAGGDAEEDEDEDEDEAAEMDEEEEEDEEDEDDD